MIDPRHKRPIEVQVPASDGQGFISYPGKPIYGGDFGYGEFAICAVRWPYSNLPEYRYTVIHINSGQAFSLLKDTRRDAMSEARLLLRPDVRAEMGELIMQSLAEKEAIRRRMDAAAQERAETERRDDEELRRHRISKIGKRRQEIFDASDGKCHYCAKVLDLAGGGWHVEHKTPRSRGGGNDRSNLVAACASCNIKKRTKTAEEFIGSKT